MLKGIHFILTYMCNFQCDHCFLYCHPFAKGAFSIQQIKGALEEFKKIETITSVGFEGGEAFLFYPILCESVRIASQKGFNTSIQTNCYWATTKDDAILWLKPLKSAGLASLDVSDDTFHHGDEENNNAGYAISAAGELGIEVRSICIKPPEVENNNDHTKGDPIYIGGPKLRGRAIEKLTKGLPTTSCSEFTQCPYEDFKNPGRVHVDPFGNVHLCQGISMGNMWKTPFSSLLKNYDPKNHPIAGPILKGGPLQMAKTYNIPHKEEYVDACHMCSKLCLELIEQFPEYLTPRQVYGLE
jgi:MoaA/NifB/PqqE/SkfB family radical SAM enzyme